MAAGPCLAEWCHEFSSDRLETDYKKSTQTFYFIALLILKIMLKAIQISKQHILRIPKW